MSALVGLTLVGMLWQGPAFSSGLRHQGKSVKEWVMRLCSWAPGAREEAHAAFEAMGATAVPDLVRLLNAADWPHADRIRASARSWPASIRLAVFRLIRPPPAVELRLGAARALGIVGPRGAVAVRPLEGGMRDDDAGVAQEAARALIRVKSGCVAEFRAALEDKNVNARRAAALVAPELGTLGGALTPDLIRCLGDPEQVVSGTADSALQRMGAVAVTSALGLLAHESTPSREKAVEFILKMYKPQSAVAVGPTPLPCDTPALAAERLEALQRLKAIKPARSTQAILTAALNDPCSAVRAFAVECLESEGESRKLIRLIQLLQDTSPEVRAGAARAVGALGPAGRPALHRLRLLESDETGSVRDAALWATARILEQTEAEGPGK